MSEVRTIVSDYLRANGHDGLCIDLCGCGLDDLMPCCTGCHNCTPAKKAQATAEDVCSFECEVGDTIYVPADSPSEPTIKGETA